MINTGSANTARAATSPATPAEDQGDLRGWLKAREQSRHLRSKGGRSHPYERRAVHSRRVDAPSQSLVVADTLIKKLISKIKGSIKYTEVQLPAQSGSTAVQKSHTLTYEPDSAIGTLLNAIQKQQECSPALNNELEELISLTNGIQKAHENRTPVEQLAIIRFLTECSHFQAAGHELGRIYELQNVINNRELRTELDQLEKKIIFGCKIGTSFLDFLDEKVDTLIKEKKTDAALTLLDDYSRFFGTDALSNFERSMYKRKRIVCLVEKGCNEDAKSELELIKDSMNDLFKAKMYSQLGDFEKATDSLELAYNQAKKKGDYSATKKALVSMARVAEEAKEPETILRCYLELLGTTRFKKLFPAFKMTKDYVGCDLDNFELYTFGRALSNLGYHEDALKVFLEVSESRGRKPKDIQIALASTALRCSKYELAFDTAMRLQKTSLASESTFICLKALEMQKKYEDMAHFRLPDCNLGVEVYVTKALAIESLLDQKAEKEEFTHMPLWLEMNQIEVQIGLRQYPENQTLLNLHAKCLRLKALHLLESNRDELEKTRGKDRGSEAYRRGKKIVSNINSLCENSISQCKKAGRLLESDKSESDREATRRILLSLAHSHEIIHQASLVFYGHESESKELMRQYFGRADDIGPGKKSSERVTLMKELAKKAKRT